MFSQQPPEGGFNASTSNLASLLTPVTPLTDFDLELPSLPVDIDGPTACTTCDSLGCDDLDSVLAVKDDSSVSSTPTGPTPTPLPDVDKPSVVPSLEIPSVFPWAQKLKTEAPIGKMVTPTGLGIAPIAVTTPGAPVATAARRRMPKKTLKRKRHIRNHDPSKREKLDRKAELARQSRIRQKEYISELEGKVRLLECEIAALSMQLVQGMWNTMQKQQARASDSTDAHCPAALANLV